MFGVVYEEIIAALIASSSNSVNVLGGLSSKWIALTILLHMKF